jgi:hypothetical protein
MISEATSSTLLASVTAPTLVLDREGGTDDLTGTAAAVARNMRTPHTGASPANGTALRTTCWRRS